MAGAPAISSDQWQQLISLLGNVGVKANEERLVGECSNASWIIDTSASHHVTGPKLEDPDWSR